MIQNLDLCVMFKRQIPKKKMCLLYMESSLKVLNVASEMCFQEQIMGIFMHKQ